MCNTLAIILFCAAVAPFCLLESVMCDQIDESHASSVTKKALALPGQVSAQILHGGLSGASLFVVTTDCKKYVIRFLTHKTFEKRKPEIAALKIASQKGYGPQLYFVDPAYDYVIMEYLYDQLISDEQRQSNELYKALGNFLKKIHNGPGFPYERNVFATILENIQTVHAKNDGSVPLKEIEGIVQRLKSVLVPYIIAVPTHCDLNPNNLIFRGQEFRAIDYEGAAQSDPYVDIATPAIFYGLQPNHERVLLSTYLEREPFPQELAKLYLMKQVMLINYSLILLKVIPADLWSQYNDVQGPSYDCFFKHMDWAAIDLKDSMTKLQFVKVMLGKVIADEVSQEFLHAMRELE